MDIIDEAIDYFKANVLFRNFDIQGTADTLLVYLTVYLTQCLAAIQKKSQPEAAKILYSQALANFTLPGEKDFPLGGMVQAPASRADSGTAPCPFPLARLLASIFQLCFWCLWEGFGLRFGGRFVSSPQPSVSFLPSSTLVCLIFCPCFLAHVHIIHLAHTISCIDLLKAYLTQARQELGNRIVQRAYAPGNQVEPSKWWMLFAKFKFLSALCFPLALNWVMMSC